MRELDQISEKFDERKKERTKYTDAKERELKAFINNLRKD